MADIDYGAHTAEIDYGSHAPVGGVPPGQPTRGGFFGSLGSSLWDNLEGAVHLVVSPAWGSAIQKAKSGDYSGAAQDFEKIANGPAGAIADSLVDVASGTAKHLKDAASKAASGDLRGATDSFNRAGIKAGTAILPHLEQAASEYEQGNPAGAAGLIGGDIAPALLLKGGESAMGAAPAAIEPFAAAGRAASAAAPELAKAAVKIGTGAQAAEMLPHPLNILGYGGIWAGRRNLWNALKQVKNALDYEKQNAAALAEIPEGIPPNGAPPGAMPPGPEGTTPAGLSLEEQIAQQPISQGGFFGKPLAKLDAGERALVDKIAAGARGQNSPSTTVAPKIGPTEADLEYVRQAEAKRAAQAASAPAPQPASTPLSETETPPAEPEPHAANPLPKSPEEQEFDIRKNAPPDKVDQMLEDLRQRMIEQGYPDFNKLGTLPRGRYLNRFEEGSAAPVIDSSKRKPYSTAPVANPSTLKSGLPKRDPATGRFIAKPNLEEQLFESLKQAKEKP